MEARAAGEHSIPLLGRERAPAHPDPRFCARDRAAGDRRQLRRSGRRARIASSRGKSVEDLETRFTIMSRKTYEKLESEMKRLSLELRTSIPAAIEKARELGDLRENAEYEAAKLRQANAGARLQEPSIRSSARGSSKSIEIDDSRVGVGTETVLAPLEENGPALTYWILGEGTADSIRASSPTALRSRGRFWGSLSGARWSSSSPTVRAGTGSSRLPGASPRSAQSGADRRGSGVKFGASGRIGAFAESSRDPARAGFRNHDRIERRRAACRSTESSPSPTRTTR